MKNDELLSMSESLKKETDGLYNELFIWCAEKLATGSRPIPLHLALVAASEMMNNPQAQGLEINGTKIMERQRSEKAVIRRSKFSVVDADEGPEE